MTDQTHPLTHSRNSTCRSSTQPATADQPDQPDPPEHPPQYAYSVRHYFGKEGRRKDYTPYNCSKVILGPGPGHG